VHLRAILQVQPGGGDDHEEDVDEADDVPDGEGAAQQRRLSEAGPAKVICACFACPTRPPVAE